MLYNTSVEAINRDLINAENIKALLEEPSLQKAAELLRAGEVVAFPTETVYGLGADALNPRAVERIFQAKGRPRDNPLIIHIADKEELQELIKGELSCRGEKLISAFWPGPLTIILEKSSEVPPETTAGLDSVALRMPSHPVARVLIKLCRRPLAAPSANSSGYPSPTRARHVLNDLEGKIPLIIDGGPCPVGVESTVVDIRDEEINILRPGGIPEEELERVLGYTPRQSGTVGKDETPASPGLKYRHYSPTTPLIIYNRNHSKQLTAFLKQHRDKKKVFIICDETDISDPGTNFEIVRMGPRADTDLIAHRLFHLLRSADKEENDLILIEKLPAAGLGKTIMNRLYKAAADEI
ncbi:MAG: L-threonylcarbamoyladenylate synthase [Halanaerobiales bacterium]